MFDEINDCKIVNKDESYESSKKKKIVEIDETNSHLDNSESEDSASINLGSSKKHFKPPVPHSIVPVKSDVNKSISKVCFSKGTSEIKNSSFLIEAASTCALSPKRVLKSAKEHQSTPFSKAKGGDSDQDSHLLSDCKLNKSKADSRKISMNEIPSETFSKGASARIIKIDESLNKINSEIKLIDSSNQKNIVAMQEIPRKEGIMSVILFPEETYSVCDNKADTYQPNTSPQKTKCSDNDLSENKTKSCISIKSSKASCFKKSKDKSNSPDKKELGESEIKQQLHSKCYEDADFIKYQTMFDDSTIDIITENNTKMNSLPSAKNEGAIEIEFDEDDLYN